MKNQHNANSLTWIILKSHTRREKTRVAQVEGGWLFKFRHFHGSQSSLTSQAMIFIPDPKQEWCPEEHTAAWEQVSRKTNCNFGEYTDCLKIWNGCIYKDSFFTGKKEMHISLAYAPVHTDENTSPAK